MLVASCLLSISLVCVVISEAFVGIVFSKAYFSVLSVPGSVITTWSLSSLNYDSVENLFGWIFSLFKSLRGMGIALWWWSYILGRFDTWLYTSRMDRYFFSFFSTVISIEYSLSIPIWFSFWLIRTVFIAWCSVRIYSVWLSGGTYLWKIVYQNLLHLSFCCSHHLVIKISLGFPVVSYQFCLRCHYKICSM